MMSSYFCFLDTVPHGEEEDIDDVLYSYPRHANKDTDVNVVERLKGVYIALNGIMKMLTGEPAMTACFERHHEPGQNAKEEFTMRAIYVPLATALYVAVLPDVLQEQLLIALIHEHMSLLRFLTGNIEGFLRGKDAQLMDPNSPIALARKHRVEDALDPLFNMLLRTFSQRTQSGLDLEGPFRSLMGSGVPYFRASPDLYAHLDHGLCMLEGSAAAARSEVDLAVGEGPLYIISSSCLFHRGLLVASHMPPHDVHDVSRFCIFRQLFSSDVTMDTGQTILIQEVFTYNTPLPLHTSSSTSAKWSSSGNMDVDGSGARARERHPLPIDLSSNRVTGIAGTERRVLLIVAQSCQVLCVLMLSSTPSESPPSTEGHIDPYNVIACVGALHRLRVWGRFKALEGEMAERNRLPSVVDLAQAADVHAASGGGGGGTGGGVGVGGGGGGASALWPFGLQSAVSILEPKRWPTPAPSPTPTPVPTPTLPPAQPTVQLTSGALNVLFHFVAHEGIMGAMISPLSALPPQPSPPAAYLAVRREFFNAYAHIHQILARSNASASAGMQQQQQPSPSPLNPQPLAPAATQTHSSGLPKTRRPLGSKPLGPSEASRTAADATTVNVLVTESAAGALHDVIEFALQLSPFAPTNKPSDNSPAYWATGRMYGGQRTVYVCHHASVPQSMVELGFRLLMGVG